MICPGISFVLPRIATFAQTKGKDDEQILSNVGKDTRNGQSPDKQEGLHKVSPERAADAHARRPARHFREPRHSAP